MAYLPPEQAAVGTQLAVSYMEELYPVTVLSADATPVFDPDNERLRSMTRVLVAVKRVADTSGEVVLTEDGQGLDGRFTGYTIGDHDACAVELAIRVAEAGDGVRDRAQRRLVATPRPDPLRDGAWAPGPGSSSRRTRRRWGPPTSPPRSRPWSTARPSAGSAYDLVVLGNDAADTGDFQVPVRLAHALGRPIVTGARMLEVSDGVLVAQVQGPYADETYELPLPAVVSVLEGGAEPRYPTLRGRMAAKKVADRGACSPSGRPPVVAGCAGTCRRRPPARPR